MLVRVISLDKIGNDSVMNKPFLRKQASTLQLFPSCEAAARAKPKGEALRGINILDVSPYFESAERTSAYSLGREPQVKYEEVN